MTFWDFFGVHPIKGFILAGAVIILSYAIIAYVLKTAEDVTKRYIQLKYDELWASIRAMDSTPVEVEEDEEERVKTQEELMQEIEQRWDLLPEQVSTKDWHSLLSIAQCAVELVDRVKGQEKVQSNEP